MSCRPNTDHTWWPTALATACLLTLTIAGCPPSDPTLVEDTVDAAEIQADADALLAKIEDKLPDPNSVSTYTISGAEGPPGALFGVGMENATIGWVLGEMSDDSLEITGVALTRASGPLILQQDIREDGTKFTLPAGDTLDIAEYGSGLRITMQFEATNPPSVIVADVDASGNLTINEAASSVYLTAAADYDPTRVKPRGPNPLAEKALTWEADQDWCTYLGNELEWILGKGCEAYTLVTGKAPAIAIDRLCVATSNFMDGFQNPNDPVNFRRAVAGMKVTLTVMCELTKAGWSVARVFKGLSPWDLACHVFNFVTNASITFDGRTLADRACGLWGVGPSGAGAGSDTSGTGGSDGSGGTGTGGTGGGSSGGDMGGPPLDNTDDYPVIPLNGTIEVLYYSTDSDNYFGGHFGLDQAEAGDADFDPADSHIQLIAAHDTMYIDWDATVFRVDFVDVSKLIGNGSDHWSVMPPSQDIQPPLRYGDCSQGNAQSCADSPPFSLDPGEYVIDIYYEYDTASGSASSRSRVGFRLN